MFLYALTFAGCPGSCLNTRPLGRMFKYFPLDPASVNAMKQTCVVFHALTFARPHLSIYPSFHLVHFKNSDLEMLSTMKLFDDL